MQCIVCGKRYQNTSSLNRHSRRVHAPDPGIPRRYCDLCHESIPENDFGKHYDTDCHREKRQKLESASVAAAHKPQTMRSDVRRPTPQPDREPESKSERKSQLEAGLSSKACSSVSEQPLFRPRQQKPLFIKHRHSSESGEGAQASRKTPQTASWQQRIESLLLKQQTSIEALHLQYRADMEKVTRLLENLQQNVAAQQAAQAARTQLKPKVVRQHVAYYLFTRYPKAAVIKESAQRHQTLGHLKLSTKLNELSATCSSQTYDTSKLSAYMRTLRAHLRKRIVEVYDEELAAGRPIVSGPSHVEAIAQRLTHILFAMFKECGIYPSTASLKSHSWCPEIAPIIQEELRCLISPNLLTYAACIWQELFDEDSSAGEISFRGLSDMALHLSLAMEEESGRKCEDTHSGGLNSFVNLTADGFREAAEFFNGAATTPTSTLDSR